MKMLQIVLDQKGQEWNVIQIENSSPLSSSLSLSSKIHIQCKTTTTTNNKYHHFNWKNEKKLYTEKNGSKEINNTENTIVIIIICI